MSDQTMKILWDRLHKCEFHRLCGLRVISLQPGYAEIIMDPAEAVLNPQGGVHGGALFTLCDLAAGTAAAAYGQDVVTQNADIHYLRPALHDKRLTAKTREMKKGRKTAIYEVSVTDEDGREIALAIMTMFFVGGDGTLGRSRV